MITRGKKAKAPQKDEDLTAEELEQAKRRQDEALMLSKKSNKVRNSGDFTHDPEMKQVAADAARRDKKAKKKVPIDEEDETHEPKESADGE